MSLFHEYLRRIFNLGGGTDLAILAAQFVERRANGRSELHCLLCGFEAVPGHPNIVTALTATLTELLPPERKAPVNDNSRMSSGQRRARFAELVERDGLQCRGCGCLERTIWRRMGVWSTEDGCRYTKVCATSVFEVDHKEPLWLGGSNDLENLWLLCVDCHKRKTALEASQRRRA